MEVRSNRFVAPVVALLLAVALLGVQAGADALAPAAGEGQGAILGRAGFAYVTTFRRFAAAVLWNRMEPQFHEFYGDAALKDMTFVLPNTRMVVALDPQLVEPYYVTPFILLERGRTDEAFALAAEGVRNNPDSGRLHASYAQMLQIGGRLDEAVKEADAAMEATWAGAAQAHDGLAMVRGVYQAAGETAKERAVVAELERIDAEHGDELPADGHDHDGDGRPDH